MLIHVYSKMQLVDSFTEQLKFIALKPTEFRNKPVSRAAAAIKESILLTQMFFAKGGLKDNQKLINSWHKSIDVLEEIGIGADKLNGLYLKSRFWSDLDYWKKIDEKEEFLTRLSQLYERVEKYAKKTKPAFSERNGVPLTI